jgi:predicted nucleic acid-binding protein
VTDSIEESLERLQAGEREALLLCQTLKADLFLMDERLGRIEAARKRIGLRGTLGIMRTASRQGMIDIEEALERLRSTSFHASPRLMEGFLEEERQWRSLHR